MGNRHRWWAGLQPNIRTIFAEYRRTRDLFTLEKGESDISTMKDVCNGLTLFFRSWQFTQARRRGLRDKVLDDLEGAIELRSIIEGSRRGLDGGVSTHNCVKANL